MKTKLLVLSAIFILATFTLQAQMGFGILGGLNLQNLNGKDSNGDKLTNDMIIGFHAGINIQIPIVPQFYFQPGLLFTTKGAKNTNGTSIKLSYVELPLNVVYKALLGSGYFMLGFGPYVAYGIGGKVVPESGTTSKITFKKSMESGDVDFTVYKPFDAGGNILIGYEMAGGIFLQLDAQLGMLNIWPENSSVLNNISTMKNTGFGLSLGYRF